MDATQLKRIPLFADASDEELAKVATFAQSKEVPEGMKLISLGHFEVQRLKKDAPGVFAQIEQLVEQRKADS